MALRSAKTDMISAQTRKQTQTAVSGFLALSGPAYAQLDSVSLHLYQVCGPVILERPERTDWSPVTPQTVAKAKEQSDVNRYMPVS